jgi:hypothetical protein
MTPPNTVHTIRHAIPPSAAGNLLAASEPGENRRNQWGVVSAYRPAMRAGGSKHGLETGKPLARAVCAI